MKNHPASFFSRAILALFFILTAVGCAGREVEPPATATTAPSSTPEPESTPTATASITIANTGNESAPTLEPIPAKNALYEDAFTDPSTGWPEAKFDNYFIGYHEPEYYHVEIESPHYRTAVFLPEKPTFNDATIEAKVQTNSKKTAAEGDFIYGLVFRRSGDQYYAFAISMRNKKWFVLKSSPNELTTLAEGEDASIHDLDENDSLRVDAQGSNFFFHINDRLVSQMSDPDYASGEVGFYVQSFDSPQTHVHFDELRIWNFEAPGMCDILTTEKLNVRSGPGTTYPATFSLSKGATVEPLGQSTDGEWIKVGLEGREQQGWIANSPEFVSCNTDISVLPVVIEP